MYGKEVACPHRRPAPPRPSQRAPVVLSQRAQRCNVLRVWVAALLDKGGRLGAQRLTQVLAANPATAPLFAGVAPDDVSVWPAGGWR